MICTVIGYSQKEANRSDEARTQADLPTRFARSGAKKREPVSVSREQAERLKTQSDSPQGKFPRPGVGVGCGFDFGVSLNEYPWHVVEVDFVGVAGLVCQ